MDRQIQRGSIRELKMAECAIHLGCVVFYKFAGHVLGNHISSEIKHGRYSYRPCLEALGKLSSVREQGCAFRGGLTAALLLQQHHLETFCYCLHSPLLVSFAQESILNTADKNKR